MWIMLNNAFLSVVKPHPDQVPKAERMPGVDLLMVRARKEQHLKNVFVGRRIYRWKRRDYPCRVFVDREQFAAILVANVAGLDYTNFKDSVRDTAYHDALMGVWSIMNRYGHGGYDRPYSAVTSARQTDFWQGRWPTAEADRDCAALDFDPEEPWLGMEPDVAAAVSRAERADADSEVCGMLGCTATNPCRDCIAEALPPVRDRVCGECRYPYGDVGHNPDCSRYDGGSGESDMRQPSDYGTNDYGPFGDDDEGAQSHLRVPPR